MKNIFTILWILLLLCPTVSGSAINNSTSEPITVLPSAFSWRDINGTDYTTAIRDPSPAPTCETYAICAALETKMQYQLQELYSPDLSENHLFFNAGGSIEK